MNLNHIDEKGRARMVDVTAKNLTERIAVAQGKIRLKPETLSLILEGKMPKGDVLAVARVAGIMAAKKASDIIPMCHPLLLTGCTVFFRPDRANNQIEIQAEVKTTGKTGVEMEALTAVSAAGLTIYDMCKAVDKDMVISDIMLVTKTGGKSGDFSREDVKRWEE